MTIEVLLSFAVGVSVGVGISIVVRQINIKSSKVNQRNIQSGGDVIGGNKLEKNEK